MWHTWQTLASEVAIRGFILAGVGLLVCLAIGKAPHTIRYTVTLTFLAALAVLPALLWGLPRWELEIPVIGTLSAESPGQNGWGPWIFFLIWLTGVALCSVRLWLAGRAVKRLASQATPVEDGRWLSELRDKMEIRVPVRLALTQDLNRPIVCGIFRPLILLPSSSKRWSDQRCRWVLAHELAHVRRHDLAIQALVQWLCALHWFNPFAWCLARELNCDRELAADQEALRVTGNDQAGYARELLCLVKESRHASKTFSQGARQRLASAALIGATSSRLETRIRGLLKPKPALSSLITVFLISGFAAFTLIVACCLLDPVSADSDPFRNEIDLRLSADPFPGD